MNPSKILAATLSVVLLVTPALAAGHSASLAFPLAPGKPAGSKEAALLGGNALLYVGIFAALAAIIATTAGQGSNDTIITPSTTGTTA